MNKLKIPGNLFDLTDQQIEQSKMIYDCKIIKCLVAPYHSFSDLAKVIEIIPNTYLFPERDHMMSYHEIKCLISAIVHKNSNGEIRIVTASQTIIGDMIDSCVRILTQNNEIIECPEKTFLANIHTIRSEILEDEGNELTKEQDSIAEIKIDKIIGLVNKAEKKGITQKKI